MDSIEEGDFAEWVRGAPPDTFILPFSLPIVDATMHAWAVEIRPFLSPYYIKRTQLTLGSVEYAICGRFGNEAPRNEPTVLLGTILIHAIKTEQAYLGAEYGRKNEDSFVSSRMSTVIPDIVEYIYMFQDFMRIDATRLIRRPTASIIPPDILVELNLFEEAAKIPEMPHPERYGYPAWFAWDKRFGRLVGITSDKELAKRAGLSHDHVRAMRVKYGESRRDADRD